MRTSASTRVVSTSTPILVGTNANEGGFRPFRAQFAGTTPEKFEAHVRAAFGKYADKLLAAYPHATPAQAEQASEDLFFRDTALAWKTWAWARLQSAEGHDKAYLYYFDRRSPQEPLGPVHIAEIPYVFGSVGQTPSRGFGPPGPADVTLSQQMQSYWVNFAKSGDPNGPGLPHWPAFSASSQRAMYLDDQPHAGPVPNLSKLEVLDAYFSWLREEDKEVASELTRTSIARLAAALRLSPCHPYAQFCRSGACVYNFRSSGP